MIVVNSSVRIALLRGEQTEPVRTLRSIQGPDGIIVGDLILLEVLQGAREITMPPPPVLGNSGMRGGQEA